MRSDRNRSGVNRRQFVLGLGSVSVGGAALLGSGALSRGETQRSVTIESVDDENAYLRIIYRDLELDDCIEEVELLRLTNQFKESLDTIDVHVTPEGNIDVSEINVPDGLDVGEEDAVTATIECLEGNEVGTLEFVIEVDGDDTGVESHRPKVHEDEIEVECPEFCPLVDGGSISFITFFGGETNDTPDIDVLEPTGFDEDGEPTRFYWESEDDIDEIVVFTGQYWFLYLPDGETSGTVLSRESEADYTENGPAEGNTGSFVFSGHDPDGIDEVDQRCQNSPGIYGEPGRNFDYVGDEDGFWDSDEKEGECN